MQSTLWSPNDTLGDSLPSKLVLSAHDMLGIAFGNTDVRLASPA